MSIKKKVLPKQISHENPVDIGKYFRKVWSSADFGRIKPCKDFFELAIQTALKDNPNEEDNDNLATFTVTQMDELMGMII